MEVTLCYYLVYMNIKTVEVYKNSNNIFSQNACTVIIVTRTRAGQARRRSSCSGRPKFVSHSEIPRSTFV